MPRICAFCGEPKIPDDAYKSTKYHDLECARKAKLKQNRERAPKYRDFSPEKQEKQRQWQKQNRQLQKVVFATQNEVKRIMRLADAVSEPVVILAFGQLFDQLFSGSSDCNVEVVDQTNGRKVVASLAYGARAENPESQTLLEFKLFQGPGSTSLLEFTEIQIRSVLDTPVSLLRDLFTDMKRLR